MGAFYYGSYRIIAYWDEVGRWFVIETIECCFHEKARKRFEKAIDDFPAVRLAFIEITNHGATEKEIDRYEPARLAQMASAVAL